MLSCYGYKNTHTHTLSVPKEILLESKIPTDVSLLSGTWVSVASERRISIKKVIRNHQQCHL